MTVETKPLKPDNSTSTTKESALISRHYIDYTHKPTRVILGLVLVLYSAWATIFVVGGAFHDVAWWHTGVGYAVGAVVAITFISAPCYWQLH